MNYRSLSTTTPRHRLHAPVPASLLDNDEDVELILDAVVGDDDIRQIRRVASSWDA